VYTKNRTAGSNHGTALFLVVAGAAQGALLTRTAWRREARRSETAFSIFCRLKVWQFALFSLFFCFWFVLHVVFCLSVCLLFALLWIGFLAQVTPVFG
jgi:hypothetical protein